MNVIQEFGIIKKKSSSACNSVDTVPVAKPEEIEGGAYTLWGAYTFVVEDAYIVKI